MAPQEYLPALSLAPTAIAEKGATGIRGIAGPNHLRRSSWNKRSLETRGSRVEFDPTSLSMACIAQALLSSDAAAARAPNHSS